MKENFDEDEKTLLISCVRKIDGWIIDSGCSNHNFGDRSKFENIGQNKGSYVKFDNDVSCLMKGKGSI